MYSDLFLPKIEVLLLGETLSGKSSIFAKHEQKGFFLYYEPTICVEFFTQTIDSSLQLKLWDTPGLGGQYASDALTYYKFAKQFLYCVDLTKPINKALIAATLERIRSQGESNGNPVIFLVGTKSDLQNQQKITPSELDDLAAEFHCAKAFITSAKKNEGIDELFKEVTAKARELHAQKESDKAKRDADARAAHVFERDRIETPFHASLKKLKAALDGLPPQDNAKKIAIYAEADRLINALKNPVLHQKSTAIIAFYNNCRKHEWQQLSLAMRNVLKAVIFVAIAAIITLICAAIGFAIGLAAGAWLGPGAFVTAIVGGTVAAKAALAASSVIGAGASYYATSLFFKPSPVLVAAQHVKTAARTFNPLHPIDMTDVDSLSQLPPLQ